MIAQALALACTITVFPAFGTCSERSTSRTRPRPGRRRRRGGAGGCIRVGAPAAWRQCAAVGKILVVLRASGLDLYDKAILPKGNFASVQTVFIPPRAPRSEVDRDYFGARRAGRDEHRLHLSAKSPLGSIALS